MKYVCDICGYVYDPELGDPDNGVAPRHALGGSPRRLVCPLCGVGKRPVQRRSISLNFRGAVSLRDSPFFCILCFSSANAVQIK